VGPYKQFVVYEKRRAYVQYVVFYKSDRPVPKLPPMPKITKRTCRCSDTASGATSHRSRTPSPGMSAEQPSSEDASDDDEDDRRSGSWRGSSQSLDGRSSLEDVSTEQRDVMNDRLLPTTDAQDSGVKKVAVVRNRTLALLQAHGQFIIC